MNDPHGRSVSAEPDQGPGAEQPQRLRTNEQGLVFEYPANWRAFHFTEPSSFSSLIAILSTVDVADPCVTQTFAGGGGQVSCQDRYTLVPDSLVVRIEARSWPMWDILSARPAGATALTVGGLPAYVGRGEVATGDGADQTVQWTLARPGSVDNYYAITAAMRGPDIAPMRAALDALVASLHYDTPVVPLPTGYAAADAAIAKTLSVMPVGYDPPMAQAWSCFPRHVGTAQGMIESLPNGPPLAHPQLATCTVAIEPTPLQMWRATFTLRLPAPDPLAGLGEVKTIWIEPDGTPNLTSGAPIPAPSSDATLGPPPTAAPDDLQASMAVLDAYLQAFSRGDCVTARTFAVATFTFSNGDLCGQTVLVRYRIPPEPAATADELVYAAHITTTGTSDRSVRAGEMIWFYDLRRQPDGSWRLAGGGSGP